MERIDVAVIGGGVVGLAAAAAVRGHGFSVCLVERRPRFGLEASTHNSGVIHAGLYYPAQSLKAELCVEGRERLYRFCRAHAIPHARTGKLVVAREPQDVPALEALAARGRLNGVDDLEIIGSAGMRRLEPHVRGHAAIWSPSSGIIDAEALVRALVRAAREAGAHTLPGTAIVAGTPTVAGIELTTTRERIAAGAVVNAAGLFADEVSAAVGGERYRIVPVRGEYAELAPSARHRVQRPVYPLPEPSGLGLGVHLTPTPGGGVTLGPTAAVQDDKTDYEHARLPVERFLAPARRLIPALEPGELRLGGSGIRASLVTGQPGADFLIRRDARVPALIQAAGIDSPGLTCCLAIAERIAAMIDEVLH